MDLELMLSRTNIAVHESSRDDMRPLSLAAKDVMGALGEEGIGLREYCGLLDAALMIGRRYYELEGYKEANGFFHDVTDRIESIPPGVFLKGGRWIFDFVQRSSQLRSLYASSVIEQTREETYEMPPEPPVSRPMRYGGRFGC